MQKNQKTPYLRQLRELRRFSRRALAEQSGVSAEAIKSLENGNVGRPGTIEALAAALDVLPQDLMGSPAVAPELWSAYLNELASEKKTIYDAETAGMTDVELGEYVRRDPVLRRLVGAIHKASEERGQLVRENTRAAG